MTRIPYTLDEDDPAVPPYGLIVLQTDETLEPEFGQYFSSNPSPRYVTRIPSSTTVTTKNLASMKADLASAASLLPKIRHYPVIGYGCTSASSVIGSAAVEKIVQKSCDVACVTNPLRAAIACARHHNAAKLALLSPYIEEVNIPLRAAFAKAGLTTDVFATFGESQEAKVVRISQESIVEAGSKLGADPNVDALFLSCTNLRTIHAIPKIEQRIGKPVFSSNQALAWHISAILKGAI